MDKFIEHFVRRSDGVWECASFVEWSGPTGRIQVTPGSCFTRGTNFMGVDLAHWLDQEYERGRRRSPP